MLKAKSTIGEGVDLIDWFVEYVGTLPEVGEIKDVKIACPTRLSSGVPDNIIVTVVYEEK